MCVRAHVSKGVVAMCCELATCIVYYTCVCACLWCEHVTVFVCSTGCITSIREYDTKQ